MNVARPSVLIAAVAIGLLACPTGGAETFRGAGALRAAIDHLAATFPHQYPRAEEFLHRLEQLQSQARQAKGNEAQPLRRRFDQEKRQALLANPLLAARPILFVVRGQYLSDHHNTATMFQTGEINTASFRGGGALKTIDLGHDGAVATLLESPRGVIRDPDVRFDGKRVLFSMRRRIDDDYHLYEINADGSDLKQLTFGAGLSDIDPIYLPSGQIMFTSTREPKFCMCNRHVMGNLFVMNADGSNIEQVGHSTLHEGHPTLAPDGRVLYDRWEYVDRNFGDAQGVWTVNPDGTNHAVYWGNNTNSPGAVLDTRIVPGTELAVATFSSCHDRPWGALALIDRRLGLDGKRPVLRTWPPEARQLIGVGNYDTFKQVAKKYEDPYPLSERFFLCSAMTGKGEEMGLWLVDTFGNEVLLHAEGPGCFDPMPLAARKRPPLVPPRIDLAQREGYFYVADVYRGTGMETVRRGSVKSLRVVESPEKRFWTRPAWNGSGTQAPGMAWDDFDNKRILGTVPVEADGSAYFAVPADRFVYFQLLDGRGMMLQSMRSGTIIRPGETTGCVGCHDQRRASVPGNNVRRAMLRAPSRLDPWHGPPRKFSYTAEVQPVWDHHCVVCHDYGKPAGQKLNLAGDLALIFNTSYIELRSKQWVKVVGAGPYQVQKPTSWGSHASRLVDILLQGHGDPALDEQIHLGPEDFDRVVTWIDINAPYYADYASAYRGNQYGRSPLDPKQLNRLGQLTGLNLADQRFAAYVSFTRPQVSRCLEHFADKEDAGYGEALAIIEAGRQMLRKRPRADMQSFALVDPTEIRQEAKYEQRRLAERRMRESIVAGRKQYEGTSGGQ